MNSYGKLSTAFYDLDKPYPPPDALAFYTHYARAAGSPILEPMCGSGRFLIPLMQEGFKITGVDASYDMLSGSACRAAWRRRPWQ
ncbi:MAG: class I SAM-dependent methyltransferase [Halospina sp.]